MNYTLVWKDDSLLMKIVGILVWPFCRTFAAQFWTTIRLPFCDAVIYLPASVDNPEAPIYRHIVAHELVHVRQLQGPVGLAKTALLYLLLPMPFLFSGRWFVEREAFTVDIDNGTKTVDEVVGLLWSSYGWPWPRRLMRRWFHDNA